MKGNIIHPPIWLECWGTKIQGCLGGQWSAQRPLSFWKPHKRWTTQPFRGNPSQSGRYLVFFYEVLKSTYVLFLPQIWKGFNCLCGELGYNLEDQKVKALDSVATNIVWIFQWKKVSGKGGGGFWLHSFVQIPHLAYSPEGNPSAVLMILAQWQSSPTWQHVRMLLVNMKNWCIHKIYRSHCEESSNDRDTQIQIGSCLEGQCNTRPRCPETRSTSILGEKTQVLSWWQSVGNKSARTGRQQIERNIWANMSNSTLHGESFPHLSPWTESDRYFSDDNLHHGVIAFWISSQSQKFWS